MRYIYKKTHTKKLMITLSLYYIKELSLDIVTLLQIFEKKSKLQRVKFEQLPTTVYSAKLVEVRGIEHLSFRLDQKPISCIDLKIIRQKKIKA